MDSKFYKKIGILILIVSVILTPLSVLEYQGCIDINKSLSLFLQFLIVAVFGTIAKLIIDQIQKDKEERLDQIQKDKEERLDQIQKDKEERLDQIQKERTFYLDMVTNYNKAKALKRNLDTQRNRKIDFDTFISYKNQIDHIQLEFERLRDYFIINDDIHIDKKRNEILNSINGLESALRDITKPLEKEGLINKEELGIEQFLSFTDQEKKFLDSFDEFQKWTYNYHEKKVKVEKENKNKPSINYK